MVNHFATLLANISSFEYISITQKITQNYALADSFGNVVVTSFGKLLASNASYPVEGYFSRDSKFISRNYVPIVLPTALKNFYDILFPTDSSIYFKEFLLYCYLRLISTTDQADAVARYDSRISYDLDSISDYRKPFKVNPAASSSPHYDLLVTGKTTFLNSDISNVLNFIITQIPGTSSVRIYCPERELYYKAGKAPSKLGIDMDVPIQSSSSPSSSLPVAIGDTGLSFTITGKFNDPQFGFLAGLAKTWTFSVDLPYSFDFFKLYNDLNTRYLTVDSMLDFHDSSHDTNYRNIWNTHHNNVYKLAVLLLAYVDRVNSVWLSKAT